MSEIRDEFYDSLTQGFVNAKATSSGRFTPRILTNDEGSHSNVLSELRTQLKNCTRFDFAVAFITESGIATIIQLLIELREHGIPGRILTTTYNNFNDPAALRKLLEFPNIETRVFEGALHTKGYFFQNSQTNVVVIGSANLTQAALCANKEWNVLFHSFEDGEIYQVARREYEQLWRAQQSIPLSPAWLDAYESYRAQGRPEKPAPRLAPFTSNGMVFVPELETEGTDIEYATTSEFAKPHEGSKASGESVANATASKVQPHTGHFEPIGASVTRQLVTQGDLNAHRVPIRPNNMQREALASLKKIHAEQAERALLISATGTGKTYLSAFDIAERKPKRVLFVAHRRKILDASMRSYQRVLGNAYSYGIYAGSDRDSNATCVFGMVSTLVRHLNEFDPLTFDYIVVDETHRAGAASYRELLSYFAPKFVLGMTATPQRTDHYDIFKLFNHVIAYRITLLDALREEMLVPFHYYGIADLQIDDEEQDDLTLFNRLTDEARVDHVIQAIEDYSVSKEHRRGLIFCSRNDEAQALSEEFNARGYRTRAISGETPEAKRDQAIADLEAERLQYLFSVDILNEGVDIPSLNQIIMLRPTQSAIVFVQQLGRGLRKCSGKDSVLVLDFIGNYQNNYLIPIALSGDCTYDKDNLRRFVKEGSTVIPGCSTVSFDHIAEARIFEKLDSARFSSIELAKGEYLNLKAMLGRVPSLLDFDEQQTIDPLLIFQCTGIGSYHDFLSKYEPEYKTRLTGIQERMLRYVSKKLADGKRLADLAVLQELMANGNVSENYFAQLVDPRGASSCEENRYGLLRQSVVACLTNTFVIAQQQKTFEGCVFLQDAGEGCGFAIASEFEEALASPEFRRQIAEIVEFGLHRYARDYSMSYGDTDLVLYQKYSYEDAFRMLGWPKDVNKQNVGGYMYNDDTNTFPVFINYEKEDDISETTKYEDRFVSNRELVAISKSKRKLTSNEIVRLRECESNGVKVYLFVRKNKNDSDGGGKEFYFLGEMHPTQRYEQFTMPNSTTTAVEIGYELDEPVRADIYDYLTSNIA